MNKAEKCVQIIKGDIENKSVLEVACGGAEFSLAASAYAQNVSCVDIDDSRLNNQITQSTVHFEIMDARKMDYTDESFDTVVIYNALFHIKDYWGEIEKECKRVLKNDGTIYVIATWKLDGNLMAEMFLDEIEKIADFSMVKLVKE